VKIFRKFQISNKSSVLTIGNFDGIHLGHQKIFSKMTEIGKNLNLKRILLTFEPHPHKIIKPNSPNLKKIISLKEKLKFLQHNNMVDEVYLIKFNQTLKNTEAKDFIENTISHYLKTKSLLIGYDFSFGKNKKGDFFLLQNLGKELGFAVERVLEEKVNQQIISSTAIRKYISEGKVEECRKYLGRNYFISGKVIEGKKLARTMGFPTANIKIKSDLQHLRYGVYEVVVHIDNQKLPAIANYGTKPTFAGKYCLCEVHIFNFDHNIYGQNLNIEFIRFIREERKFTSIKELRKAIEKDCQNVSQEKLSNTKPHL
jgi:riboflavin kinase/FMN adenylyltransferase